eukprot:TRINITY_DN113851_c0_g1_i1.p2 TRINITY_DN113851_c0_g1~~TRINITY_DN113851_c0_g1_i1.p2  ORF type:complete len:100 (-),score=11.09 TRINITY_DN113851_c0_g1_i1:356-655(-)
MPVWVPVAYFAVYGGLFVAPYFVTRNARPVNYWNPQAMDHDSVEELPLPEEEEEETQPDPEPEKPEPIAKQTPKQSETGLQTLAELDDIDEETDEPTAP